MPLGPQLDTYRFPSLGRGFLGVLDPEGSTASEFQLGYLWQLYNYHLIGRGRLLKRQGSQTILAATINGAAAIQGMTFFNLGSTDYLVAVSNTKLKQYNGSAYTDITGSLTLTAGDDYQVRFAQFQQEATTYLVGTGPNNGALWCWSGTGNAVTLASLVTDDGARGPSRAVDIAEWDGRLWAINTDTSPNIVEYSEDGEVNNWPAGNFFYPARSSKGMGLARHNNGMILAFYEDSVHRIESDPVEVNGVTEKYTVNVVDANVGASSTSSIINSQGITYFASERGIYRIKSGRGPAEYISYPIQEYWKGLNQARIQYMVGFELGGPGNEVGWLASTDTQTQHNVAIIWNPNLEGWTIFRSTAGYLKHSAACRYISSTGQKITMLGGYDGKIWEAWGDNNHDVGYLDGGSSGSAVISEISTGMLDLGWDGLKRLKKVWLEIQLNADVSFTVEVEIMGGVVTNITPFAITAGAEGDKLSIDFIFDTSVLGANDTPEQVQMKKFIKGRKFRLKLTENVQTQPHTLNSINFLFKRQGRKFSAY